MADMNARSLTLSPSHTQADVNTVGECDANLLIMVIKMYLSDI